MLKGHGCLSEIFKESPKRYQDPYLWVWLEISFHSLASTNCYGEQL